MPVDFKEMINEATLKAYAKGIEALSQEEFDALILMAKGLSALKAKYAANEVGFKSALMQEDILALLGIGINQQYLQEKRNLLAKMEKHKAQTLSDKHAAIEEHFNRRLIELRNKYQIDIQLDAALNNSVLIERTRRNFTEHLAASFIEEDIDVKKKRPHESHAEFKTKQKINQKLTQYNQLRADYLVEEGKIEAAYQAEVADIKQEIALPQAEIKKKYESELRKHEKKTTHCYTHFPEEVLKKLSFDTRPMRINFSSESLIAQEIEQEINELLENHYEKLAKQSPDERVDTLFEMMKTSLEEKGLQLKQQKQEELTQAEQQIAGKLKIALEKKTAELNKLKKKHQSILKKSEQYFTDEVLPLIKELKAQQAHKYFVVIGNQLATYFKDNHEALSEADSNTIAFVSLVAEHASQLSKLSFVHHVGMKAAEEAINEKTQNNEKPNASKVKQWVQDAVNKGAAAIGETLATAPAKHSKEALAKQIALLEETAVLKIPQVLAEDPAYQPRSLVDYIPSDAFKQPSQVQGTPTFFDFIEEFNRQKGVVGKAEAALKVYQALIQPNPELSLSSPPTAGHLFAKALGDEALAFNYKLLHEFGSLLKILEANEILARDPHYANWTQLSANVQQLEKAREQLDKSFTSLQQKQHLAYEQYHQQENKFNSAQKSLHTLEFTLNTMNVKLSNLREERKIKEAEYYKKELSQPRLQEIHKQLEELSHSFRKKWSAEVEKHEQLRKNETAEHAANVKQNEQILKDHKQQLQQAIVDGRLAIIKRAYGNENGVMNSWLATTEEMNKFAMTSLAVQAEIAAFEKIKQIELAELEKRYEATLYRNDQQYENKVSSLEAKHQQRLKNLQAEEQAEREKITQPIAKLDKILTEIDNRMDETLNQITKTELEIKRKRNELFGENGLQQKLVAISRDFHKELNAFNEEKNKLDKKVNELLNKALAESATEPHLAAMQAMIRAPHTKVNAVAAAAQNALPALSDEISLRLTSYEDVAKGVLEAANKDREIQAIQQTTETKSLAAHLKDNVVSIGAATVVAAIGENAVSVGERYVQNMPATLAAEHALAQEQQRINKAAGPLQATPSELVPVELHSTASSKKSPFGRLFGVIAEWFAALKKRLVGTSQEQALTTKALDKLPATKEAESAKLAFPNQPHRKAPLTVQHSTNQRNSIKQREEQVSVAHANRVKRNSRR